MKGPLVCVPLLALAGCAANPVSTSETGSLNSPTAQAIAAKERTFEACLDKRDAACAVNGFYVADAEDPVASPPGGTAPIHGRRALTDMFEHALQDIQSVRLEQVAVIVRGEMASELGRSHVTLKNGKTAIGRFNVLWLHGADGWRAKLDFFTDDGWSN